MKRLDLKIALILLLIYGMMSWVTRTTFSFYVPTTIDDFFMPGSQPHESGTFETPDKCEKCHGGYDDEVEPSFTYEGSMMGYSMEDPLFEASLTIANQDALFSGDLCIRCHTPRGWLSGHSTPTDGSALTAADRGGIQCHFCHKLIDPQSTLTEDLAYINTINYVPNAHGNGMYVVDSDDNRRRGPYSDAQATHETLYSPFHSKSELCATCHDVSNPAFTKAPDGTYQPNTIGMQAPSFNKYDMFPVERTYSEWKMSAYNSSEGVPSNVFGGNKSTVSSCIDCHMKDVSGKGCNKNFAPFRTDLAMHDLTGGNTFVPLLIKDKFAGLVKPNAIDAGIIRATYMLENAATMNLDVTKLLEGYEAEVQIINETGHKLPSGYPEGRRMWINLQAYNDENNLVFESGKYDFETAELEESGTKIYEARLGMSEVVADLANANNTGTYSAGESFHFALNNLIIKDNRIPPRGFTNANFEAVQAKPVGYSYPDGAYSDVTTYTLPEETNYINVKLLYQTTSKEYVEFLKDKNVTDTKGQELYDLWVKHGKSEPVIMQETDFYISTLGMNRNELINSTVKVYPNPTHNELNVQFDLKERKGVLLEIYSLNGSKIKTLFNDNLEVGKLIMNFNVSHLSNGIYLLKFKMDGKNLTRQLVVK